MKIGDLIRLKPAFLGNQKAELPSTIYLIIRSTCPSTWGTGAWTVMDPDGKVSRISVSSEFAYEIVSDARNCYNDDEGHICR